MNTQTLIIPALDCNFVVVSPTADFSRTHPIQACSRDYGFDFDEDEIGRELLAPLPVDLSSQGFPEIDADEFEQVFQCFLS
jgi:hypothetical protein